MMGVLLDPYSYDFFARGVLVATLSGALCGLVGVYVVLRGMSYIGHGLAHAIFGGYAASAVLGISFFVGAGLWGVASALAINKVARRHRIGADAAIGVITTASFAAGVALMAVVGSTGPSFEAALFGNVFGISTTDLVALVVVALAALVVVVTQYRPLLFTTFDPEVAEASGVRVGRVDALLMLVLSMSILVTLSVIGVTLVAAAIVIPAVVARMLTSRFRTVLCVATVVGAVGGFVGMNLSYHLDVPPGTMIVVADTAAFAAALLVAEVRKRRMTRSPASSPTRMVAGAR